MQKNILNEKKKLILFLSVLILFSVILTGCNWFGEGILNVFDPKSQIRVNYTDIDFTEGEGSINLEIYSLNQDLNLLEKVLTINIITIGELMILPKQLVLYFMLILQIHLEPQYPEMIYPYIIKKFQIMLNQTQCLQKLPVPLL